MLPEQGLVCSKQKMKGPVEEIGFHSRNSRNNRGISIQIQTEKDTWNKRKEKRKREKQTEI